MSLTVRHGFFIISALSVAASGCFALFSLDGYGPGGEPDASDNGFVPTNVPPTKTPPPAVDARPPGKIIFVTSKAFPIAQTALNGVANATQLCTQAAQTNPGIKDRTFQAWLSTETFAPQKKFAGIADAAVVPEGGTPPPEFELINLADEIIASSYAELAKSGPRVPLTVTEKGDRLPAIQIEAGPDQCPDVGNPTGFVWSGTVPSGARDTLGGIDVDCNSWTSADTAAFGRVGAPSVSQLAWTTACKVTCDSMAHLYCFEQ